MAMSKQSSLKSRIIVIVLGIALGYLAKAIFNGPTDSQPARPRSILTATPIDWRC